ncbi:DUF1697 domain-containing protein [Planosporangium mesophilum]|uniref:DUF1697 domain-containing protein n=1 Tax=Planosporangium mesophilum TaxID=689768 RepID=A0A8J3X234_9ACTN|nr:DUF1697 domain-containing protein [Planosporangium mesophilum]NJC85076.1 DUF1697 domain-containing protein [Planosporangium mesophilum]GII24471.1 hypothetical protein Pme01_40680 [Planosporangium mesophilum]
MAKYAALLRGVNVGGHGTIAMTDLRRVLESLGHTEVSTYLQSGNAVVSSDDDDPERIGRRIEEGLERDLGLRPSVLIRTGAELATVIAGNPFPQAAIEQPKLLHVAFLSAPPDPELAAAIDPGICPPDEFGIGDRAVYLRYAVSSGRSKLADLVLRQLLRGRPEVTVTARNWNTVEALAAKLASPSASA